jgi:hypothetical protein
MLLRNLPGIDREVGRRTSPDPKREVVQRDAMRAAPGFRIVLQIRKRDVEV